MTRCWACAGALARPPKTSSLSVPQIPTSNTFSLTCVAAVSWGSSISMISELRTPGLIAMAFIAVRLNVFGHLFIPLVIQLLVQVYGCADQSEMRKGLWEITQVITLYAQHLGVQA